MRCLDFLPDFCVEIGASVVVDDFRSTSTFTDDEFERLIKSKTRPPDVEPAWQCVYALSFGKSVSTVVAKTLVPINLLNNIAL